MLIIRVTSEH